MPQLLHFLYSFINEKARGNFSARAFQLLFLPENYGRQAYYLFMPGTSTSSKTGSSRNSAMVIPSALHTL